MDRLPVTPNMRIADLVARHPQTRRVLHRYGIRCEDCHASRYESIGHGARVHDLDLHLLLTELNHAALGLSPPTNRPLRMARSQTHV